MNWPRPRCINEVRLLAIALSHSTPDTVAIGANSNDACAGLSSRTTAIVPSIPSATIEAKNAGMTKSTKSHAICQRLTHPVQSPKDQNCTCFNECDQSPFQECTQAGHKSGNKKAKVRSRDLNLFDAWITTSVSEYRLEMWNFLHEVLIWHSK